MSTGQVTYDLVLLLDPAADDAAKQRVLAAATAEIQAKGQLLRHDEWGLRPLAYPIDHKGEAEYHLIQFHVGDVTLLAELDRSLRIADGAIRFMITKLEPGTPDPPQLGTRGSRPAEPTPAAAAAAPAAPAPAAA